MNLSLIYAPYSYVEQGNRANQVQAYQTYRALCEELPSVVGIFPSRQSDSLVKSGAHYILMPEPPLHIRQILGYRFEKFVLAAVFALRAYLRYVRSVSLPRPQVVYCRDFSVAFVFNFLKRLRLIDAVILEIHNLPDLMPDFFQHRYQEILIELMVRSVLSHVDAIVPTTRATEGLIQDRYNCSARVRVIPNAHRLKGIESYRNRPEPPVPPFKVGYAGLTYARHSVTTLLDAIKYLDDEIQISLAGGRHEEITEIQKAYSQYFESNRARHVGRLSHEAIVDFYAQLHIGVHLLQNDIDSQVFRCSLKVFEYMAMGLPIVAIDLPSVREILNETNAVFFSANDPVSLANAINNLYRNQQLRQSISQQALRDSERYSYSRKAHSILDLVRDIL